MTPSSPKPRVTVVTVRDIPVDLWRQLKLKSVADGVTIYASVTQALEQYLEKSA